jgi:hypothetical protein
MRTTLTVGARSKCTLAQLYFVVTLTRCLAEIIGCHCASCCASTNATLTPDILLAKLENLLSSSQGRLSVVAAAGTLQVAIYQDGTSEDNFMETLDETASDTFQTTLRNELHPISVIISQPHVVTEMREAPARPIPNGDCTRAREKRVTLTPTSPHRRPRPAGPAPAASGGGDTLKLEK